MRFVDSVDGIFSVYSKTTGEFMANVPLRMDVVQSQEEHDTG